MSGFFQKNMVHLANGAKGGFKLGLSTGVLMSAYGSGAMTVGTLLPLAGASALSGAILILPALILLHKIESLLGIPFEQRTQPSHITTHHFLLLLARPILAAGITMLAAGLIGMAIVPALKATTIISLSFGLMGMLSTSIHQKFGDADTAESMHLSPM